MQIREIFDRKFSVDPSDLAISLVRNSAVSLTIDMETGTVSVEDCGHLRSKFEQIGLNQIPSSRIFIRIFGWQEIRQQDIRLEQYFYL